MIPVMDVTRALSLLAHDLRSPAAVVAGYARMLREGRLNDEQRAVAHLRIEEAGARIATLCQQASDLAVWLSPRPDTTRQPVELDLVVSRALTRAGLSERMAVAPLPPHVPVFGALDRDALIGAVATVFETTNRRSPDEPHRVAARPVEETAAWDILIGPGSLLTAPALVPGPEHAEPLRPDRSGSSLALLVAEAVIDAHGGRLWTTGPRGDIVGIRLPRG
jgi:K+-sensing histidine kinase KdpD